MYVFMLIEQFSLLEKYFRELRTTNMSLLCSETAFCNSLSKTYLQTFASDFFVKMYFDIFQKILQWETQIMQISTTMKAKAKFLKRQ